MDKVNNIFVGNVGLDDNAINYFETLSTKIVIINTGVNIATTKDLHTKEWIDAVNQKTCLLREMADSEAKLPLVIMDVDQVVLNDFSHVFDPSKDIQVCKREKPAPRPDMTMDYIGSFFVVNNRNALPFLDRWIERIGERIAEGTIPAYESPALCETIENFKDKLAIGELSENVVSCNNNYVKGTTCIIHLKSETAAESEDIVSGRVNGVQNYDQQAILRYASFNSHNIEDYIAYKKTRKAKVVIYTAISSHFDDLVQHTYISKEFDYVCYTDQQIKDPGIWEVRPLDDRGLDRVRSAKYYKVFPNKFFTDYDYSIWIDGNIDVLTDELEVRVKELITSEVLIAASKHFERDCVYQEANVCILNELDDPDIIEKQVELLRKEGFPENQGLFEMNIIYRNHQDHGIVSLMQAWWEMIVNYSRRDQLSFMYVLWKNKIICKYLFNTNPRLRFGFSFHEHNKTFYSSISIISSFWTVMKNLDNFLIRNINTYPFTKGRYLKFRNWLKKRLPL